MSIHPRQPGYVDESAGIQRADIQRSLGRIEGKLDSVCSSFLQHMQDDASNFKEIKLNISIMQKKLATWAGGLIILGFLVSNAHTLAAFVK